MKIIWVRHGTVDRDSEGADTLTAKGKELASKLPDLLKENNLHPDLVCYDESEKFGKKIKRCKETVAGLVGSAKMVAYRYDDVGPVFEECKKVGEAVVCYTSESLRYFPKIEGSVCAKYMGSTKCGKPPPNITNVLYERIIVSEYDGSVVRQISEIATGDGR